MKIHTYYEFIDDQYEPQDRIIDVWRRSWAAKGWEPVVLGPEVARRHELYYAIETLGDRWLLNSVLKPAYALACYRRWMAYEIACEDVLRWSDYDVMNADYPVPSDPNGIRDVGGLWLADDDAVPCVGGATKDALRSLNRMFRNVALLRKAGVNCIRDDLNDMNLIRDYGAFRCADLVSFPGDPEKPLVHFPHHCVPNGTRVRAVNEWAQARGI